jgi:hypothetical protein
MEQNGHLKDLSALSAGVFTMPCMAALYFFNLFGFFVEKFASILTNCLVALFYVFPLTYAFKFLADGRFQS